jgi:prolyl 4-hydroxylase
MITFMTHSTQRMVVSGWPHCLCTCRSDVEAGGETVFPASQVNSSLVADWDELTECAKAGFSVRPHMGDALLFWSMKPDATLDASSLHGGCPVVKGNKWSATKWLHVEKYSVPA